MTNIIPGGRVYAAFEPRYRCDWAFGAGGAELSERDLGLTLSERIAR